MWEKILGNLQGNVVLYCNILQKDCKYMDHTMKLYLFDNVTISQLIYLSIYLHIYSSYRFIISSVLEELINAISY